MTILKENPNISNWWKEMERKYKNDTIDKFDLQSKMKVSDVLNKSKTKFNTYKDKHIKENESLFLDIEFECFCKL